VRNDADGYTIGFLGLINGMFGADEDGYGPIAVVIGEDDKIVGFTTEINKPKEGDLK
jgi:hypothetical protein